MSPSLRPLLLVALLLIAAPGLAKPAPSPLDVALKPAIATQRLIGFRQQVRTLAGQGRRPLVVFDVDDTLVRLFSGKGVKGAAAFVKGILSDGARVIYQCGRKESSRVETEERLTKNGFPLNQNAELWLKASSVRMPTVDWKKSQKPKLEAIGLPIGFFDNEKCNSRMFRSEFPESCVFRLKTSAYYPDPGGTGTIYVIKDFCTTN